MREGWSVLANTRWRLNANRLISVQRNIGWVLPTIPKENLVANGNPDALPLDIVILIFQWIEFGLRERGKLYRVCKRWNRLLHKQHHRNRIIISVIIAHPVTNLSQPLVSITTTIRHHRHTISIATSQLHHHITSTNYHAITIAITTTTVTNHHGYNHSHHHHCNDGVVSGHGIRSCCGLALHLLQS